MAPRPTNEEEFSFGLWTVGWQGRHQFGDAVGGDRGYGFVRRNESALERLLGAR